MLWPESRLDVDAVALLLHLLGLFLKADEAPQLADHLHRPEEQALLALTLHHLGKGAVDGFGGFHQTGELGLLEEGERLELVVLVAHEVGDFFAQFLNAVEVETLVFREFLDLFAGVLVEFADACVEGVAKLLGSVWTGSPVAVRIACRMVVSVLVRGAGRSWRGPHPARERGVAHVVRRPLH